MKLEMVEHILFESEKYEVEKRKLVRKFKSSKSQLSAVILRFMSGRKEFQILFQCLREIEALSRMENPRAP